MQHNLSSSSSESMENPPSLDPDRLGAASDPQPPQGLLCITFGANQTPAVIIQLPSYQTSMTTMEDSMPPLLASTTTMSPSPSSSPPASSNQNQQSAAVTAAATALSMSPSDVEAMLASAVSAANNGDDVSPPPPLSEAATTSLLANLAGSAVAGSSGSVDGLDKEERPCLSYKDLIIEAIESSAEKRLKLSEIYQVIRILHPYYRKRADQWGWQNSIRHNLSLHDCFVKLPLKQTSASGVVGHFWTVVRDREDKQSSSRRRNRNSNKASRTNGRDGLVHSNSATSMSTKIKDRQSVSSDSGVMSDESQASSPAALLMDSPRKDSTIVGASPLSTLAQFQRSNSLGGLDNSMLQRFALNALLENANSNPLTAALAAATSPPVSVGSSNLLESPIAAEIRRLQLQLYLQQQQQQQQPQQLLQQLLEAQHQQQQAAVAAAAAASAVPSLLSQLLLGLKTKDVAPVQQIPVSSPPVSTTLDLLSMLQGGLSTQAPNAPPPASPPQSVAEPATPGAGIDLARLLSTMANASTHQLQSPPTSSSGLNPLLEQQILAFSNQSPPASSKDNLCVM
uniref:Fork-head domain-containing protein n=1 Tax=Panagrellus redivivus TaxID=6233 RepID=A0A7E4W3R1_PANRE